MLCTYEKLGLLIESAIPAG